MGRDSRQPPTDSISGLPPPSSYASSAQDGNPILIDNDNPKRQWSHLFANNRKPLDDFMLKK
ncbi:hypothetical protein Dimus_030321, partial [Dionaea muscipula]